MVPRELTQLLVEEGVVGSDDVDRALARQREAGGTLDSALLELGLVAEDQLIALLARASDLPAAPLSVYDMVDARSRRVFPSKVAERHGLAPFALEGRELSLVATHPLDLGLLDEISFMLSLHLSPHVGPEWRVRSLIQRLYGGALPPRLVRLAQIAQGTRRQAAAAAATAPPPAVARGAQPPGPSPDGRPRRPVSGFHPSGTELEPLAAALAQAAEAFDLDWKTEPAPAPPPLTTADEEEPPAEEPPRASEAPAAEEPPPPATPSAAAAPPARRPPIPGPSVARPHVAPHRWTLDRARAVLAEAETRDAVVLSVLHSARDFFQFAALFAVTRDAVAGHDALGPEEGMREVCRTVALYSTEPGIFRTALDTLAPYLGPVDRQARGSVAVLDGLGRGSPRTALVYPILLRHRPVCILYADNGAAPVSPHRLGDLLLFLSTVGGAFERIIRSRKAELPAPGPAAAAAAEVPAPEPAPAAAADAAAPEPAAAAAAESERPSPSEPVQADGWGAGAEGGAPGDMASALTDALERPEPVAETPAREPAPVAEPRDETPIPAPDPDPDPAPDPAPERDPERDPAPESATDVAPPAPPAPAPPDVTPVPPLPDLAELEEAFFSSPPGAAVGRAAAPAPSLPPAGEEAAAPPSSVPAVQPTEAAPPAPAPAPPPEAPTAAPPDPAPPEPALATAPPRAGPVPTDPAALVGTYLVSPRSSDERAMLLARLAEQAEAVAPILCEHLPGPYDVAPEALSRTPASEQGPVFAAVAALGPAAVKPLLLLLADPEPERRRAAAVLLGQSGDARAFLPLTDRCFDHVPAVAEAARDALAGHRRDPAMKPVPERLRRALLSGLADKAPAAARAIGALRDAESIPLLIQALEGSDATTAAASADALAVITMQRHGVAARAWLMWWKQNRGRSRAEWLFGALTAGDRELRLQAATELREVAATPVSYSADLPEVERRVAAQAWATWFTKGGHRA